MGYWSLGRLPILLRNHWGEILLLINREGNCPRPLPRTERHVATMAPANRRTFSQLPRYLSFWAQGNWCTAWETEAKIVLNSPVSMKGWLVESLAEPRFVTSWKEPLQTSYFHNSKFPQRKRMNEAHFPGALSSPSLVRRLVKRLATNLVFTKRSVSRCLKPYIRHIQIAGFDRRK